jgi:hypothetical protein
LAIMGGDFQIPALVEEAGLRCPVCGSGTCARSHAWRYRRRVTDLSTGEIFEQIPILRVRFCSGPTRSIMPADLWRGRSTVGSVLQTVVHVLREGVGPALEWAAYAGAGEEPVSERSVRRWKRITQRRLIGAALSWLTPQLGWAWSDALDPAEQLERLLPDLTGPLQVAFRGAIGHGILDRPSVLSAPRSPRSSARPVPGRLTEAPPHDPPSILLSRGTWWPRTRRGPPPDEEP